MEKFGLISHIVIKEVKKNWILLLTLSWSKIKNYYQNSSINIILHILCCWLLFSFDK